MEPTSDDIRLYRRFNTLADEITRLNKILDLTEPKVFKRREKLSGDIAKLIYEQREIEKELIDSLGPQWGSRCVEHIVRSPAAMIVSVIEDDGRDEPVEVGYSMAKGVKFIVGTQCFEVRRVERGMDGRAEG